MAVSVVASSFNGAAYIEEQIRSILQNLGPKDELIVSDDGSTDGTLQILESFSSDPRVKILHGPGKGVKQNVAFALSKARGDILFLADQDDVWSDRKVETVLRAFEDTHAHLIVHDAEVVDADGTTVLCPSYFAHRGCGAGFMKNTMRNTYIGCCMAFKRVLLPYVLPIPEGIEMHDQWIGLMAGKHRFRVFFLEEKLLRYRRHGDNTSSMTHYPLPRMVRNRANLIRSLIRR